MKHLDQIKSEFLKIAGDHPMQGDPGYGLWFTKELKRRTDENHAKEASPNGVPDGTEFRTFNFTVKVESAARFFECGQDCPYLEYQGNPQGEYRGTPWCNLFKKDLGYPRSPDGTSHPIRSPECISAVEGLM